MFQTSSKLIKELYILEKMIFLKNNTIVFDFDNKVIE